MKSTSRIIVTSLLAVAVVSVGVASPAWAQAKSELTVALSVHDTLRTRPKADDPREAR